MHRLAVILAICGLAACSRYELVSDSMTPYCTDRAPTVKPPPVSAQVVPEMHQGTIRGTVVSEQGGLDYVRVTLSSVPAIALNADAFGRFELQNVTPGRYLIVIHRIGFETARDSITVPRGGGVLLHVQLEMAILDGPCSGFAVVRVRKPWWKFW